LGGGAGTNGRLLLLKAEDPETPPNKDAGSALGCEVKLDIL